MLFYQSELVRIQASSGGTYPALTIPVVQSVSTQIQVQRNNSMRLGHFSPSRRRQTLQDPLVNVSIEYNPIDSEVEKALGLIWEDTETPAPEKNSAIRNLVKDDELKSRDFNITVSDVMGGSNSAEIILSDGVLTSYSFQASVGEPARSSINLEFLDIGINSADLISPQQLSSEPILRSQDIEVVLPTGLFGLSDAEQVHVQNFSVNIPLNRNSLMKIGDRKPFSRELQAPVIATFQLSAIVSDFKSTSNIDPNSLGFGIDGTSDEVEYLTSGEPIDGEISVTVNSPDTGSPVLSFVITDPHLDDFSLSNSVGGHTTVNLQFSVIIPIIGPGSLEADQMNLKIT